MPSADSHAIKAFDAADLAALWIGHATVLLNVGGVRVLTDPVFSERIGVHMRGRTFGIGRLRPASHKVAQLPDADIVLLSHAHFDHLDRPSLKALVSKGAVVVTAQRTWRLIPKGFQDIVELGWGEDVEVRGVHIRAMRPEHWGARTAVDRRRGYNSYVIESAHAPDKPAQRRVLFAGDTAHTHTFDFLSQVGSVDLAVFGIGAYNPWIHLHANPEQVWNMFSRLQPQRNGHAIGHARVPHLLPMHHSTFELGDEHPDEPMQRLMKAAGGIGERVVCRNVGDVWVDGV